MSKPYASQESIAETLTYPSGPSDAHASQLLGGPFVLAQPDPEPLPRITRECVLADDAGVIVRGIRDVIAAAGGGA